MASQNKFSTNLLAITGFITAIGGLVTVLHQTGVFSPEDSKASTKSEQKEVVEPQKPVSDVQTKVITNNANKSQEEIDAMKLQLQQTQAQLDQMKDENSRKTQTSQPVTAYNTNSNVILTGTWQDAINYGRYVFGQDALGELTFQEYSYVEGTWVVTSEGSGHIKNNSITLNYMTLYSTSGRFNGVLQNDGSIKGIATDNASGIQVQLHLKRQ